MNKEFETWWNINKFRLMEDDEVGLREIALAAYLAGKEAAEQSVHPTDGELCAVCGYPEYKHSAIGHEFDPAISG